MIQVRVMAFAVVVGMASTGQAALIPVGGFGDILLWAGSGTNQAGLVLQFPATLSTGTNGEAHLPASIAWGYRWNGTASFQDMLFAISGSTTVSGGLSVEPGLDPRLSVTATYYAGWGAMFVDSIAYDQRGLPVGWSQVERLIFNDWDESGTYPAQYESPLSAGIWDASEPGGSMPFADSWYGITGTELVNGGWYGFAQTAGESPFLFAQPVAAVPEPSAIVLVACGAAAGFVIRRRRHRAA